MMGLARETMHPRPGAWAGTRRKWRLAAGGTPGIWGLSADTDGVDGAEDIAGAVFTPDTLARARAAGCDPQATLDDNDGHGFFERLGDSLITGPTRTNVNDFRVTLIAP